MTIAATDKRHRAAFDIPCVQVQLYNGARHMNSYNCAHTAHTGRHRRQICNANKCDVKCAIEVKWIQNFERFAATGDGTKHQQFHSTFLAVRDQWRFGTCAHAKLCCRLYFANGSNRQQKLFLELHFVSVFGKDRSFIWNSPWILCVRSKWNDGNRTLHSLIHSYRRIRTNKQQFRQWWRCCVCASLIQMLLYR